MATRFGSHTGRQFFQSYNETHRAFFCRIYDQNAVREGKWKFFRNGEVRRLFELSLDQREQAVLVRSIARFAQRLMRELDKWNEEMLPRRRARG